MDWIYHAILGFLFLLHSFIHSFTYKLLHTYTSTSTFLLISPSLALTLVLILFQLFSMFPSIHIFFYFDFYFYFCFLLLFSAWYKPFQFADIYPNKSPNQIESIIYAKRDKIISKLKPQPEWVTNQRRNSAIAVSMVWARSRMSVCV